MPKQLDIPSTPEFYANNLRSQVKTLPFVILAHTLLWLFGCITNKTYKAFFLIDFWTLLGVIIGVFKPQLGLTLKAIQVGTVSVLIMMLTPKYAIVSICVNFFCLASGFQDVPLSKAPLVFIANGIGWFICYQFLYLDGYEGAELVKFLFVNKDNFTQIIIGYVTCYFLIITVCRRRYQETKFYENYQQTLINLNKELETANVKLTKANKELEAALQERENFLLRFSHEIRNPLNSLLGNIELCYELTKETDLKSMITDAKVSGEILLQLLNNVLDTAKLTASRLELCSNPHKIRDFLERGWIICSEIIPQKRALWMSVCLSM